MSTIKISSTIKSFGTFLRRLFCVPKCASCGKRLSIFAESDTRNRGIPCFCEPCLSSWCREKAEMCHNCGNTAAKCTCIPRGCKLSQTTVPSLFFYHPSSEGAASKAIFTLKHKKHTDLFLFLSKELSCEILNKLNELNISPSSCIFTHVPRSRASIRKNGFDQSLILSRSICNIIGGEKALPLIMRDGGREQKKLSTRERKKNAERSFDINSTLFVSKDGVSNKKPLSGKTVVLVDDVITSGASASKCVRLLRGAGAENVIFASVARCELKKKA